MMDKITQREIITLLMGSTL